MWHEARRQERKIRGMLVDYRKRAERRRDFYEKIKADPTQFLQVHGRQCKIHLDPQVAAAADSAVMMPWQGHADNLIDRFDVRAHLDYIPPVKKEEENEPSQEERQLNYERYRIIAQNAFLGISEEKFLKQLQLEEQFGYTEHKVKKEQKTGGAAIGFNYEDGTGVVALPLDPLESDHLSDSDDAFDGSDLDVDLSVNVSKMDATQAHEMNKHGRQFGMHSNDFYSFLTDDMEEAENRRMAREEEQEKALYAGRKSRRERRYHREKRLANRVISPPSYAAKESPTPASLRESKSPSRSPSPDNTGKITFITSFGGDDEGPSGSSSMAKPSYADKLKQTKPAARHRRDTSCERSIYNNKRRRTRSGSRLRRRSRSRSESDSRERVRKSRSRSLRRRRIGSSEERSRSRSSCGSRRWSKSRSRSYSKDRKLYSSRYSPRGGRPPGVRSYKRHYRRSTSSSTSSSSPSRKREKTSSRSLEKENKSKQSQPPYKQQEEPIEVEQEPQPKVLPRYYGRRKEDKSSSEEEESSNEDNKKEENGGKQKMTCTSDSVMGHGNSSGIGIKKTTTSMTIIERLKRKRQALLNRQFKADKIAEQLKTEREKQEQQTREDELRIMAIKLRRKQRERRHANDSHSSSSSDSEGGDGSRKSRGASSDSSVEKKKKRQSPPRSPKLPRSRNRSAERESSRAVAVGHTSRRDDRNRSKSRDGSRDRKERRQSRDRSNRKDRRSSSPRNRSYRDRWREEREPERPRKSLVDY